MVVRPGTAHDWGGGLHVVKRLAAVATHSEQLIPQAIIRDRDTFVNQPPVVPGAAKQKNLDRA